MISPDSPLLNATLRFAADFGWSIIPISANKKPPRGFKWKQFTKRQATPAEIREWFTKYELSGIAVVLGAVSGDLVCRDFDHIGEYKKWEQSFPDLAKSLPTAATRRGRHVFFQAPQSALKSRKVAGGEYRGNRNYALIAPSRHPSGVVYRWINEPSPGSIPLVDDPASSGLIEPPTKPEMALCDSVDSENSIGSVGSDDSAGSVAFPPEIERAIQTTLPTGPGQRNNCLFSFARRLKAIPAVAEATANELTPILREWHRRALPVIRTKSFDESRFDFNRSWENAILPAGDDPLRAVLAEADDEGVPPEAQHFDNEGVRRLAGLCRTMQKYAGDATFFLSCHKAGELLDVDPVTAWRWFGMLEMDELLVPVKRGSNKSRRATRWKWLGRNPFNNPT